MFEEKKTDIAKRGLGDSDRSKIFWVELTVCQKIAKLNKKPRNGSKCRESNLYALLSSNSQVGQDWERVKLILAMPVFSLQTLPTTYYIISCLKIAYRARA